MKARDSQRKDNQGSEADSGTMSCKSFSIQRRKKQLNKETEESAISKAVAGQRMAKVN
jgi:hypothetical protein